MNAPIAARGVAALVIGVLAVACGGAPAPQSPAAVATTAVPAITEIAVSATEYAFAMPDEIPGGLTTIRFTNEGKDSHNMAIVRLKDGTTDEQFKEALTKQPPNLIPVVDFYGGAIRAFAGERRHILLDLAAGRYVVLSSAPVNKGPEFVTKGMYRFLSVKEKASRASEPKADLAVVMNGAATSGLPTTIKAGAQTWKFTTEGSVRRALVLAKLAVGKTAADLIAWLRAPSGAAPAEFPGGMLALSPGRSGWAVLDLSPGDYVAFDDAPGSPAEQPVPFTVK